MGAVESAAVVTCCRHVFCQEHTVPVACAALALMLVALVMMGFFPCW